VPPIFELIQERGAIAREEMFRAFNMGVGLIVICGREDVDRVMMTLSSVGESRAWRMGTVGSGDRVVKY
jgi:phosphoribosylformylglycinamidine cyclo-ligase